MQYKTYEIVLRQLSGVNKGVQVEHSAKRYIWKYRNEPLTELVMGGTDDENETTIMVDGGTHQDMVEIQRQLEEAGIHHTYFIEPDLNYCMTAITVIADERVWNKSFSKENYICADLESITPEEYTETYNNWVELIGGEQNRLLSEILNSKKLSL